MADRLKFTAVLVTFVGVTVAISGLFNEVQPSPYMDEIFHIPQAQNYCSHNLSHWNNKITTLPGLYVVSLVLFHVREFLHFGHFLKTEEPCSTTFLRFLNVLFMFGNLWVMYELSYMIQSEDQRNSSNDKIKKTEGKGKQKKKRREETQGLSTEKDIGEIQNLVDLNSKSFEIALVLSAFPLLYFFAFLYYTDQGSTFMVLLMYWFSLQESHVTAALTGAVAVAFRQTNIIWIAFVAGVSLLRIIKNDLTSTSDGLFKFLSTLCSLIVGNFKNIIFTGFPYLCIAGAFVVFVVKNNGIVVGDRSSHQACFHLPQLLYFIGFSMVMYFPMFFSVCAIKATVTKVKDVLKDWRKLSLVVLLVICMVGAISKLSYVHKYLLADNRHFTFYIWRKIYQRHWIVKYLAIPVYLHGGYTMQRNLAIEKSGLWILLYAIAVSLVTVPQKLLELRYFIIPYLMFKLHVGIPSKTHLALELALYCIINAFSISLFLYKPFYWENDVAKQRFMW